MVKEEEIVAEAGGRGYMDLLGLGEEDYLLCLSPSSYFSSSVVSTMATGAPSAGASSPTCASYLDLAPAYNHHMLSFSGQEQYHGDGVFGLQCYGGDHAIPAAVPQKSSPTTECSSSISSMSSSPPATAISAISSSSKPQQGLKKKGSRSSDQRKAPCDAAAATPSATNKRPRVRRERLGERIVALQQLVSPFGKSDTASVLHEALGYIRFLHDQVQVLSSPYMQRQPPASSHVPESAAGTVVEVEPPRASDLRSRGLCLVPIACTEHVAGSSHSSGADFWSVAGKEAAGNKGAAAAGAGVLLPLPGGGHLA